MLPGTMRLCWEGFDRWVLCGFANMHVHVGTVHCGRLLFLVLRPAAFLPTAGPWFRARVWVCVFVHVCERAWVCVCVCDSDCDMEHLPLSPSRAHRRRPATELEPSRWHHQMVTRLPVRAPAVGAGNAGDSLKRVSMHKFPQLTGNNVPGFRFPPTRANSCATVKKRRKKRKRYKAGVDFDAALGGLFTGWGVQLLVAAISWWANRMAATLPCKMCWGWLARSSYWASGGGRKRIKRIEGTVSEPTNSRVHRRCSQKEKISTLVREAQVEHKANYCVIAWVCCLFQINASYSNYIWNSMFKVEKPCGVAFISGTASCCWHFHFFAVYSE